MLWHIFPASLKSNSAIEKKSGKGPSSSSTCNHACESFSTKFLLSSTRQKSKLQTCFYQEKNLLESGFQHLFFHNFFIVYFFWMLQKGHLTIFVLSSKTGTFLSTPLLSPSQKRIYCISNSWSNPRPISSSHQEAKHGCLVRAFSDSMNSKGWCGLWSN